MVPVPWPTGDVLLPMAHWGQPGQKGSRETKRVEWPQHFRHRPTQSIVWLSGGSWMAPSSIPSPSSWRRRAPVRPSSSVNGPPTHPELDFVWLEVGVDDNDPVRFSQRLLREFAAINPDFADLTSLVSLHGGGLGTPLLEAFEVQLAELPEVVIVLDDLHHLSNSVPAGRPRRPGRPSPTQRPSGPVDPDRSAHRLEPASAVPGIDRDPTVRPGSR